MLEGVFLFNIVVFLLIKDFVFTNVCSEYQNSTGNGSWSKVLHIILKFATIMLMLDAKKISLLLV